MKKTILRLSLPVLAGAALTAVALQPAAAQDVKIGALNAVTGPIANLVPPIIDAEQFAVKQMDRATSGRASARDTTRRSFETA